LLEPASRNILGRRRLADLCLKGALHLAEHEAKPELIQQLAKRAHDLGGETVPALRIEAQAQTRLDRHAEALALWVKLLTENPVEEQLATDYTAAAHSAFEAGQPGRAMDILTTGINRFGNDAGFALRAGWIALLTANHGRAYQFLLAGMRVGFAPEEEENACLLLAVAASLAGFPQDAASHYLRLAEIEPEWQQPETADSLDWPEGLKAAIRQLITGPDVTTPDIMLPEGGGFSTDPTLEPLPDE
jgi:tetratricopeptide (TPR) repeat protein